MEVSGQLNAPAALPPGKESLCYPLDRRLGGPQSRSGRDGEGYLKVENIKERKTILFPKP